MHEIPILLDLLIIFGLALPVIYLCHRLHVPTLVGLLLTGVLIGPNALELIGGQSEVEILAELGIILLLFVIGLEFSLERLVRIRYTVLIGGTLQVLGATALTAGIGIYAGFPAGQAIFAGFLVALSSTAIVLKMMQERGELSTPHGQTMLGILIYQDIAIVPLMLLVPFLAGVGGELSRELGLLLGAGLLTALVVVVLARHVVPGLLHAVAGTRQSDLFLMSIVFVGLLVCWFTARLGLSLSLGAFLAGLIISDSEYSHEAIAHVIPFRDVFTSLFFVSMGILLNPLVLVQQPVLVASLTALALGIGTLTAGLAALLLGYPLGVVATVAVGLNQVGEFSLILSRVGLDQGLLDPTQYQLFLSVAVLSMIITPFEYELMARLRERLPARTFYDLFGTRIRDVAAAESFLEPRRNHVVVVGFGPTGRSVVEAAKRANIPYVVAELNPDTVQEERGRGRPVVYGDAGREAVLENLGVHHAHSLVVTVSDPAASRRIVALAHRMNPDLPILARTHYIIDEAPLRNAGADEVFVEERETSRAIMQHLQGRDGPDARGGAAAREADG